MTQHSCLSRRSALLGLPGVMVLGRASLALAAAATEQRMVVIVLRGGMDGLSAVVPYGDPDLVRLRPELLPPSPGRPGGMLDLGGFYGLHRAASGMHAMYRAGELLVVHAAAGHYRSRSHFEAQDYLESGADQRLDSGWLNRALAAMPGRPARDAGVAVGVTVPLLLRGAAPVATWAPPTFDALDADLYARIVALNRADAVTGPALADALRQRGAALSALGVGGGQQTAFPALCGAAAQMLRTADGPRVAALELEGWDTHTGQPDRFGKAFAELDAGLVALRAGLAESWPRTVVLVMTEFGRTVRADGTLGTDHGTGTAAFVAGGAVDGGRVRANWPGLSPSNMLENRDLQPTTDLREVAMGVLTAHMALPPRAMGAVFPGSAGVLPMAGLIRR